MTSKLEDQKEEVRYFVKWKKHNLKIENSVLFHGLSEDFGPEDSLSCSSGGLLWKNKGGARIYSFCNKNQVVRTSKDDH